MTKKGYVYTHGMAHTRFYYLYKSMMNRCYRHSVKSYPLYGGRGIGVEERWHTFENFYADMFESYLAHQASNTTTTLERIDNDTDYSKDNCRWATRLEQAHNTRRARILTCRGETRTMAEWTRLLSLGKNTIGERLKKGWSVEEAIFTPVRGKA